MRLEGEEMSIAVVTDSAADLPYSIQKSHNVHVVPIRVLFGEEQFRDHLDLAPDQFYRKLGTSKILPTTSQPSPADFIELYRELLEQHERIVSLHISSKLSGTYQSACLAREAVAPDNIDVIDTKSGSMGQGLITIEAARAAASAQDYGDVLATIRNTMEATRLVFTVDSLDHLKRNGRIGRAASLLGTLLSIKPVLTLEDGELTPMAKVRGSKRILPCVIDCMREKVQDASIRVAVIHTNAHERACQWLDKIKSTFACKEACLVQCGAVIGVHVGPSGLGVAWMPVAS
jgi:DegV family protein with EDD domain